MIDLGSVDMSKVRNLARLAGITDDELNSALAARNLTNLSFSAA